MVASQEKIPLEKIAIEATGIDCGYGGEPIIKDLSFSVKAGEIFFVIGGSGCGKSTLLRHLVGLNRPTAGDVSFFGESFLAADAGRRRALLKRFGVLYQGGALWSSLTLLENVCLPLEEYTTLTKRERDGPDQTMILPGDCPFDRVPWLPPGRIVAVVAYHHGSAAHWTPATHRVLVDGGRHLRWIFSFGVNGYGHPRDTNYAGICALCNGETRTTPMARAQGALAQDASWRSQSAW